MGYSLGEAARFSGLAKSTLSRAIDRQQLIAQRKEDGSFDIDPEEFSRFLSARKAQPVAKLVAQRFDTPDATGETPAATASERARIALLEQEVDHLRERLRDKDGVVEDLRARLDQEAQERRAIMRQLVDLRETTEVAPRQVGWFDRLLGRGGS